MGRMRRRLLVLPALALAWLAWPEPPPEPEVEPTVERRKPRAVTTRTGIEHRAGPQPEDIDELLEELGLSDEILSYEDLVDTADPLPIAHIEIHVVDDRGWTVPWAFVDGGMCGGGGTGSEGEMIETVADPGTCTFTARRRDGLLYAQSEPLEVEVVAGEVTVIELVLPSERTGGLGVAFEPVEDGMLVVQVHPDTPADEMGLMEGDLIVEVDGIPPDELGTQEFVSMMTGPVGSEVDFVIGWDGDSGWMEEPLVLERAFLGG